MIAFCKNFVKGFPVRSVVALTLTVVYSYLAISGVVDAKAFENIFIMVVGFYFGTASNKGQDTTVRKG